MSSNVKGAHWGTPGLKNQLYGEFQLLFNHETDFISEGIV